jgi:hypothetical protein
VAGKTSAAIFPDNNGNIPIIDKTVDAEFQDSSTSTG